LAVGLNNWLARSLIVEKLKLKRTIERTSVRKSAIAKTIDKRIDKNFFMCFLLK
jgi:hypothetical protein